MSSWESLMACGANLRSLAPSAARSPPAVRLALAQHAGELEREIGVGGDFRFEDQPLVRHAGGARWIEDTENVRSKLDADREIFFRRHAHGDGDRD